MKYDTSYRIIEEPSFLMKIVNWFREPCKDCGRYGVVYSRLSLFRRCQSCLNEKFKDMAREMNEREDRKNRRKAKIFAEEVNRC